MTVNGNLFRPSYASSSPEALWPGGWERKPDLTGLALRTPWSKTALSLQAQGSSSGGRRPMEVPFGCGPCPEPGSPLCLAEWVPLRSACRRYSIRPLNLRVTSRPTKCPQVPECGGSFNIGKSPSRAWCDGCDSKTVPIFEFVVDPDAPHGLPVRGHPRRLGALGRLQWF